MKNGVTDQKKVSQNRLAKGHLTNDKNESAKKRKGLQYIMLDPLVIQMGKVLS